MPRRHPAGQQHILEQEDGKNRSVHVASSFSEKLKKTLNAYHNRAIATQE